MVSLVHREIYVMSLIFLTWFVLCSEISSYDSSYSSLGSSVVSSGKSPGIPTRLLQNLHKIISDRSRYLHRTSFHFSRSAVVDDGIILILTFHFSPKPYHKYFFPLKNAYFGNVWSILMAVVWLMVTIACPANIFYDVDNCWQGAVNSPRGYIFDKRSLSTATFVSVNSSGFLKLKIVMSIRFCIPSWVLVDKGICCDCECSSADAIFHMLEIVPSAWRLFCAMFPLGDKL